MSRVVIVTPAPPGSRTGNRITANRWRRILRSLGHQVTVDMKYIDQACDLLVVLHARKSAASVRRIKKILPDVPVVVALTGTDLYHDLSRSRTAQESIQQADRLIVLQDQGRHSLPSALREKTHVILQSAIPVKRRLSSLKRVWEVSVAGHLRTVKDPFRAALASRRLPPTSRIRISHIGKALSTGMEHRARREMQYNARYRWYGECAHNRARQMIARSRILVLSSKMEGGANVISEALADSVPVLATRIEGSVGLLGNDYSGFFNVGDTKRLCHLLIRSETDPVFYAALSEQCRTRAGQLTPHRERIAWKNLMQNVAAG